MPKIGNRTQNFTDSVIRRMTRFAMKYDAINLSQGFPDFEPPKMITDRLKTIADEGPHQYSLTNGAPNFRAALSSNIEHFMGLEVNPDTELVVTCGSTEAMICALMTVTNPGDKVIVFSPFYENYGADALLCQAERVYVPLNPPNYDFDPEVLRKACECKPKALILCNPSNPSGKVFTKEELEYIAALAIEFDFYVITDEVYAHIIYPPYKHISMASLENMRERTLTCSSLSKTYSITGWRLGYIFGPEAIITEAKKIHDFLTVGAASPLQEAAIAGLTAPDSYYTTMAEEYLERKNLFLSYLEKAGLKYSNPQGAYFVMVDISDFDSKDDERFCLWMCEKLKVAAVPGSSFFKENVNNYIRFHFAKKTETLIEAGERLLHLKEVWAKEGYKS